MIPDIITEQLLDEIVDGTYPAGARLPAERDLAARFDAARVSVREALGRLEQWHVISIRRGSGVTVRPQADWSFDVFPAYLRHAVDALDIVAEVLAVRRSVFVDAVRRVAGRVGPGDLNAARAAAARAWDARDDAEAFARADLDVIRAILDVAGMPATLWLINDLAVAYIALSSLVSAHLNVRPDYLETRERLCSALEAGNADAAAAVTDDIFTRQETGFAELLEITTR